MASDGPATVVTEKPKHDTFLVHQPPAPQQLQPPAPQLPAVMPPADPAPAAAPPQRTSRSRDIVDTLAYGLDRLAKPVLALGLIVIGGAELFGPDILSGITVSPEMATLMFFGGFGFFGINLRNQEISK